MVDQVWQIGLDSVGGSGAIPSDMMPKGLCSQLQHCVLISSMV